MGVKILGTKNLKKKIKLLRTPINRKLADRIGRVTLKEILELVSKGVSPVQLGGAGRRFRYQRYSGSYGKAIRAGRHGSKRTKPVNLRLTGKMLGALSYKVVRASSRGQGFAPSLSFKRGRNRKISNFHNDGTPKMPRRPILPNVQRGERFNASISRKILNMIRKRIRTIIKTSKA